MRHLLHSLSRANAKDTLVRSVHFSALCRAVTCAAAFLLFHNSHAHSHFPEKILTIKVDASGQIICGRDTVSSDELALYVQERLFKSYTGTGKMFDAIKFVKESETQNTVTEVVLKEIAAGQRRALNALCIEKHKKQFENLSTRQKDKLKKNFKVLFQTDYS